MAGPPHVRGFTITLRHTTLGRTPLDVWSAQRTELYLAKHKIHKRQDIHVPVAVENSISTSEGPQTHALDRVATGMDIHQHYRDQSA